MQELLAALPDWLGVYLLIVNVAAFAGTGQREFDKLIVGSKEEFDRVFANRKNVTDFSN